jgi:molybdate transport system substrate-binding protein
MNRKQQDVPQNIAQGAVMAKLKSMQRLAIGASTILGVLALTAAPQGTAARAAEVKVAVAANFTEPVKEIAPLFAKATGYELVLSFGATGQFYAQIGQGAPFEILLSADKATPAKAVAEGHAVPGTQFTYAIGKLVLYSKTVGLVEGEGTLRSGKFEKIAIANPAVAPYGVAGDEALEALGVFETLSPKVVRGNTIAQTYQFVETGNAELGFVALSQVIFVPSGSRWLVPAKLYSEIAQDAVLLKAGAGNDAARAFLAFLKGPQARAVIEKYGYGIAE